MQVVNPQMAWLGLLLLIPLVLFLIRKPAVAIQMSTLVFFKMLSREHRESTWLRRLKRWLPLFLSLAMLGGVVLALMRVRMADSPGEVRRIVVLLDRSASMGARLPDGRTRIQAAKDRIEGRLRRLSSQVSVALIAWDGRAEVIASATSESSSLFRAMREVSWRPVEGNPAEAVKLARTFARDQKPAEIWWVSDSASPPKQSDAERDREVRWISLPVPGGAGLNVGITAFQLRPLPMQRARLSCFLELASSGMAEAGGEAKLEMQIGGASFPPRSLKLSSREPLVLDFPVEGKSGQEMHLRLVAEGDCFPDDDEIQVLLPESKPVVAVRVGQRDRIDPFAHVALQSLVSDGELQVWSAEPEQWPVNGADVVVFDNWLPDAWPEGVPVLILNPPKSLGPVSTAPLREGGVPQSRIRGSNADHPVLFRVSSERLSVVQDSSMELAPGLEVLWRSGREPLLAAGEWKGQRVVAMNFSPRRSAQLPLTDSFPILIGNALYWCAGQAWTAGPLSRQSLRTGGMLAVKGKQVTWRQESGSFRGSKLLPVQRGLLELDRAGIWRLDTGETGAAHLLSLQETREAGHAPADPQAGVQPETPVGPVLPELTWLVLGSVLGLVLIDSLLFHRFAV